MAPISEARKRANAKYNAKAYEQLPVRVDKGKKEEITVHAQERGESLNGFVNRAIDETMARDKDKPTQGSISESKNTVTKVTKG